MLEIYAGDKALKTIKERGFSPSLFSTFLGASGGPKWFVLFGLDKYIFSEFFNIREQPLNLVGSSAGAFRAACFAQKNPVEAITRLATNYSETTYSKDVTPAEITENGRQLLDVVFGETGVDEILANPMYKAHFIVAKSNGLVSHENKLLQGLGLAKSLVLNTFSRRALNKQYHRYVYRQAQSTLQINDPDDFPTVNIDLTPKNIKDALLASGSIPMVMQGIKDIADSPEGMYRDGGIIDYHFDIDFGDDGLVLYPHFSSVLKAGWFDKKIGRKVRAKHYENTVVICPSQKFIDSLPHQKIPDRNDFVDMEAEQRIKYWREVLIASEQLAEAFNDFYHNQSLSLIKPISEITA